MQKGVHSSLSRLIYWVWHGRTEQCFGLGPAVCGVVWGAAGGGRGLSCHQIRVTWGNIVLAHIHRRICASGTRLVGPIIGLKFHVRQAGIVAVCHPALQTGTVTTCSVRQLDSIKIYFLFCWLCVCFAGCVCVLMVVCVF